MLMTLLVASIDPFENVVSLDTKVTLNFVYPFTFRLDAVDDKPRNIKGPSQIG